MSAESIWPRGLSRGLFATGEPGRIRVQSDDSGGLLVVDLATGDIVERRGEFQGLEREVVGTMVAAARARHLGRKAPIISIDRSNSRIYRNDATRAPGEWIARKGTELVANEKPPGATGGW